MIYFQNRALAMESTHSVMYITWLWLPMYCVHVNSSVYSNSKSFEQRQEKNLCDLQTSSFQTHVQSHVTWPADSQNQTEGVNIFVSLFSMTLDIYMPQGQIMVFKVYLLVRPQLRCNFIYTSSVHILYPFSLGEAHSDSFKIDCLVTLTLWPAYCHGSWGCGMAFNKHSMFNMDFASLLVSGNIGKKQMVSLFMAAIW